MNIDYTYHYRKWHDDSPEHEAEMLAFYKRLLEEHVPSDLNSRILDVGCGMGFALLAMKALGFRSLNGVDCDKGQQLSCAKKGLDVALAGNTPEFLKAKPGFYSLILALDVIEHVPIADQLDFVAAMSEALAPGGRIICTVPNASSSLAARWRWIDWTHHCSFTEHSIDFLLFNGGFRDIEVFPAEFNRRPRYWWLPIGGSRHWWAFCFFRLFRRVEMMAELGPEAGRKVPLSLNLLVKAKKA